MAKVSLRGVRKAYGDTEVIHGVSCDIADGEFGDFGQGAIHRLHGVLAAARIRKRTDRRDPSCHRRGRAGGQIVREAPL